MGPLNMGLGIKHLLNTVQQAQYFASKYLKATFGSTPHEIDFIKKTLQMYDLFHKTQ